MRGLPVEKWNAEKDGILNEANLTQKLERQGYSCVKYAFSPGEDFPDHTHEISKKNALLTGNFEFGMYGQTVVLEPGDVLLVPQDTVHNAKVLGENEVILFDCTK